MADRVSARSIVRLRNISYSLWGIGVLSGLLAIGSADASSLREFSASAMGILTAFAAAIEVLRLCQRCPRCRRRLISGLEGRLGSPLGGGCPHCRVRFTK